MKFKDIVLNDKRCEEDDLYRIYFHKEGLFWGAYEWSAYLTNHFEKVGDNYVSLKPQYKTSKTTPNGIVSVGLQKSSFEKYFSNADYISITENKIVLDARNLYNTEFTLDTYEKLLDEWKKEVCNKSNIKEKKITYKDIIRMIENYDLENKTPIENTNFLSDIKCQVKMANHQ